MTVRRFVLAVVHVHVFCVYNILMEGMQFVVGEWVEYFSGV